MPGVDVARVLRGARDLMNNNGRHWIKGDMQVFIDEEVLDGVYDNIVLSPKAQVGDVGYCAWGGIKEIADDDALRVEAMEALVSIIDPDGWDYYCAWMDEEQNLYEDEYNYSIATNDDFFSSKYPTFFHYWDTKLSEREDTLGDKIASWNDADQRTWQEVSASLTKAAAKCKKAA